ncbi:phosphotransferase [bacterium AH-315-K03]|nr:phosphotransferase [bacterium AH-315-K03]
MSRSCDLEHFYINEEQSFYLLSHRDAQKLKDWIGLCRAQLQRLGYSCIDVVGKGAYGFVFSGKAHNGKEYVFKFSRITLAQHIQDRLEEESYMLSQVDYPLVPKRIDFQRVHGQSILMMERAAGINLEQYSLKKGRVSPKILLKIATQFSELLIALRRDAQKKNMPAIVHGDIKPSNVVFDEESESIALIDWGAAVFSQIDEYSQSSTVAGLSALSNDCQETNAKLGDIYFIGEDQFKGGLSTPRFDEQGVAGTLYALASAQSSRFGSEVIAPTSLGLPIEFAKMLNGMLSSSRAIREKAGDYFLNNMRYMKNIIIYTIENNDKEALIPIWLSSHVGELDTVVYSSRKSFLRREMNSEAFASIDGTELEKYYKNYLNGMEDTEKAFVTAVTRLGHYPLVGGLAIRWDHGGMYIDSSLNLCDKSMMSSLIDAVNNIVYLGRAMNKPGVFKSCIFDARQTLHIERDSPTQTFIGTLDMHIPFELSSTQVLESESLQHSYFEDGDDPDEMLILPERIMKNLAVMNDIHHTGCIIFESVQQELKIHNYLCLLDISREKEFRSCLKSIIENLYLIEGLGVSGFMKLPYKDTKYFSYLDELPEKYYPKNPKGSRI